MATITTLFREFAGDTSSSIPTATVLKYLDLGIEALSAVADYRFVETLTISQADITAGYKSTSKKIVSIYDCGLYGEGAYWTLDSGRIKFLDTTGITTTSFKIDYRAKYVKLEGTDKADNLLDYPSEAELGIVLHGLAQYQQNTGITKIDGSKLAVASKSEEGMSVNYGVSSTLEGVGSPKELEKTAMQIFNRISNRANMFISASV